MAWGAGEQRGEDLVRGRTSELDRTVLVRDVFKGDVLGEVVHVERGGELLGLAGRRGQHDPLLLEGEVELVQHLALGGEQQVAVAAPALEPAHVVGEQAMEEGAGVAAAHEELAAVGRVEEAGAPGAGLVLGGYVPEGQGRVEFGRFGPRGGPRSAGDQVFEESLAHGIGIIGEGGGASRHSFENAFHVWVRRTSAPRCGFPMRPRRY